MLDFWPSILNTSLTNNWAYLITLLSACVILLWFPCCGLPLFASKKNPTLIYSRWAACFAWEHQRRMGQPDPLLLMAFGFPGVPPPGTFQPHLGATWTCPLPYSWPVCFQAWEKHLCSFQLCGCLKRRKCFWWVFLHLAKKGLDAVPRFVWYLFDIQFSFLVVGLHGIQMSFLKLSGLLQGMYISWALKNCNIQS